MNPALNFDWFFCRPNKAGGKTLDSKTVCLPTPDGTDCGGRNCSGGVNPFSRKNEKKRGTTILEIIVYTALFGIIAIIISNFLIQIVNAYNISRAEREVLSNGRLLLETVTKSLSEAEGIYTPTSAFNKDLGQISLVTKTNVKPEHETAYIDFWVDNGRLWMKKEGANPSALSAASVRVGKFRLERLSQGLRRDAVRLTLQVNFAQPKFSSTITLTATTALRGNY